jgi:hypothetical protein
VRLTIRAGRATYSNVIDWDLFHWGFFDWKKV